MPHCLAMCKLTCVLWNVNDRHTSGKNCENGKDTQLFVCFQTWYVYYYIFTFSIDVCNNAAMTLMFCRFCCQQKPQIANIKDKKKETQTTKLGKVKKPHLENEPVKISKSCTGSSIHCNV